jgi:hypothetical protein
MKERGIIVERGLRPLSLRTPLYIYSNIKVKRDGAPLKHPAVSVGGY